MNRAVVAAILVLLPGCGGPAGHDSAPGPAPEEVALDHAAQGVDAARASGERAVVREREQRARMEAFAGGQTRGGEVVAQATAIEPPGRVEPGTCTYSTYSWSTVERRAVNREQIRKAYADVREEERSPDDPRCTVCTEDQVSVNPADHGWPGVSPVRVCWAYADAVGEALEVIAEDGRFDLRELDGYRAGRTRGRVVDGLRTEWSNHSFGTAIDLNAGFNGLYRNCNVASVDIDSIDGCQLGIGGAWRPDRQPAVTIVRDGPVYRAFIDGVGWRWGGEISGSTRDLMHFSITGY